MKKLNESCRAIELIDLVTKTKGADHLKVASRHLNLVQGSYVSHLKEAKSAAGNHWLQLSPSVVLLRAQVCSSLGIRCQQQQPVDYTCRSNRIFPATDLASFMVKMEPVFLGPSLNLGNEIACASPIFT